MLEDQDWCNNLMTNNGNGSDCAQLRTSGKTTIGTDQPIPVVVRLMERTIVRSITDCNQCSRIVRQRIGSTEPP